jgi:hypothetical protein
MATAAKIEVEEWRVIAAFPDYIVSNFGLVVRSKIDARGHRLTGRPLKASKNDRGYYGLTLCSDGRKFNVRVNRVVCAAFHGPAPSALHHAAHIDGDSANNHAGNLCWKLPPDNEADKLAHGTARIGERHWSKSMPERRARGVGHGLAKLTDDDVRKIRQDGRYQREIAKDFGVSQRAVWSIKAGKTWRHVQ